MEFSTGAFVAGLLHDVGKLLIAATLPKQYDTILAVNSVSRSPLIESEKEILGVDHAGVGAGDFAMGFGGSDSVGRRISSQSR